MAPVPRLSASTVVAGAGASVLLAAVLRPRIFSRALRTIVARSAGAPTLVPAPAPKKVKVALCQLLVTADKERNIKAAQEAIKTAAGNGAELVVLPEIWNSPYTTDSFPVYAEDIDGGNSPSIAALSAAAKEHGITLVGGSVPERSNGKIYNTCCVFDKQGKLLVKHRKVHLFDIDIPGKMTFKESLTLSPGSGPTVVDTDAGRLGIGICYDMRFNELAAIYAQRGVQLIVYPGAFNTTTGPLHWELLQRARAVDNQLYVVSASPARNPESSYQAWGHSTAIGPFGEVLATTDHEEAIVYAELDYAQLEERRNQIPIWKQKRWDLYEVLDKTA